MEMKAATMSSTRGAQEVGFTMVEIEINSRCNRRCGYCPNANLPRGGPKFMSNAMFDLIVLRLHEVGFVGRMSYHFYGEPLLHPRLDSFVERVSRRLPRARQVLYTNGDFLTDQRHARLRAAGIAHFVVTYHDGIPGPARPNTTNLTPGDLALTNRGGLVSLGSPAFGLPCFAPATMLIITITGNVVLCYEDARESVILGNVAKAGLAEIWWSERFVTLRAALSHGDRSCTPICSRCSNQAHLAPATFDYVL